MALKDWETRHTGAFNRDRNMKTIKVKILLNIGTSERWVEPYQEGDAPEVDEDVAHRLIRLGWAEEYDAKKETEREEAIRDAEVRAVMPAVAARVAREDVEKEAEDRLKHPEKARAHVVKAPDPKSAATAADFRTDPHTDEPKQKPKSG